MKHAKVIMNFVVPIGELSYMDAENTIEQFVNMIGGGFHPDTEFQNYVTIVNGETVPMFSKEDSKTLNKVLEECFNTLGEEIYNIGLNQILKL